MTDFLVVYISAGSEEEAGRLARALVEEKLAACVTRVRSVRSTYAWKGKIETEEEELLIVKTSSARFPELAQRVRELHGYEVPEVLAVPVVDGSPAYLDWMRETLK